MRDVLILLLALAAAAAWAQGGSTAVVTGAERVFVRRGPGTQFPPFATLTEGSTVDVKEMSGEWARISTANGQVGYVNSNFLALPGEHRAVRQVAKPTAAAAPTAIATPAAASLSEQNKALAAQVEQLRQELTAERERVEARPTPPTGPTIAPDAQQLNAEVARLTEAVETLQRRLDAGQSGMGGEPAANPPPWGDDPTKHIFPSPETSPAVSPVAVLLALIGLAAGWLMGSAHGRRQRDRRARVRL